MGRGTERQEGRACTRWTPGLNLRAQTYSLGVRRRVARAAVKNSFDEAVDALAKPTGVLVHTN